MILLLWTAVCFALLVVDWCCWAPNRLDADMASEQLLANLLAQEGSVMSTNWYYSTELRVLNTQLVMAPLFRLFTSWHTVRVVGSVVLILLYLAAWFWFGRSAKLKYCSLLGAGLLVLPYGCAVPPVCAGGPLLYSAHCHQLCGAGVCGAHSARRAAAGPGGGHGAVQLCGGTGRAAAAVHLEHSAYRGGQRCSVGWMLRLRYPGAKSWPMPGRTPGGGAAGAHPCAVLPRWQGSPGSTQRCWRKNTLPGPGVCGLYRAEPGPPAMVCQRAAGFLWLAGGQSVFSGRAV